MDITKMTPRRPYMLRAFYDWLAENDLTPHIVVDAMLPGVRVPLEFVQDGQIILNIASRAVGQLELGNEAITFHARFGGKPHSVIVPLYSVQAIYARENGAGTMFEPEDAYLSIEEEDVATETPVSGLSVAEAPVTELPVDSAVESEPDGDDEPPRAKGRPSLRVVK
ncbi:ClpXP protease specificity-enhancing factor [Vibrio sp. ZSDZ65]|uniref:ClpXP protease specificity-enhancing factor n=1 Tax=Vibrio qingdaonensis TaxID=2829491 RepID=A0A9X3CQQ2_9VIBR|nr:ClpXP protease specificity-enhancing factor [Vibrio qingdaonensis]MCW8347981.1 ClpXP protease specificity-enhancing factor [Vibrio qingdaonensis]